MLRLLSNRRYATLDDFLIPASLQRSGIVPVSTALPGGGFVTVWMGGTPSAIVAQVYNRDGRAVGNEFAVSAAPAGTSSVAPDVGTLSSGGFVVSWASGNSIMARIYDASGAPLGAQFAASTTPTASQACHIVGLAGGGFVVTWHVSSGTFDNISCQVFAANGTKIGGEFFGGDTVLGAKEDPDTIALANGGFVIAWDQGGVDGSRLGTRAQIFDASGAKLGAAFTLNTITEGYQSEPRLAALPSGGFLAIWTDDGDTLSANPNNGNLGAWAQRFDASGNKVGDDIQLYAGHFVQDVEVIPGVGLAMIWKDSTSDSTSQDYANLRIQIFDFQLNKIGEEFLVAPHAQWVQSQQDFVIQNQPQITVLAGGGLVVSWQDYSPYTQFNYNPHTAILFPTTVGSNAADTMSGTVNRDFFVGLGGDDQLAAGGEDDVLDGGDGNDQLLGGDGKDILIGGIGADYLEGGAGADIFEFAAAADTRGYDLRSDGKHARWDAIADFVSGIDKIDLSAIDAIVGTQANDGFNFINNSAFSLAGQVRYEVVNGHTFIYADIDGDHIPDMRLVLLTPVILQGSDFVL